MDNVYVNLEDDYCRRFFKSNFVTVEEILEMLVELDDKRDALEEELEELRQDLEENYRPIPVSERLGIDDRDFY